MTRDNRDYLSQTSIGYIPGVIVLAVGLVFLLSNLDVFPIYRWWQLWPVVVIAIGAVRLVDSPAVAEKAAGGVMVGVGGFFLAATFGWLPWPLWSIWDLWPVALIGAGLVMLCERLGQFSESRHWRVAESTGQNGAFALFGGFKRRVTTRDYRGAEYVAVFGGGEIILRDADIEADAAVIHVTAIFGGIEFKVPAHWQVVNNAVGIFGGIDDKTSIPAPDTPGLKRLIVNGAAIFGGVSFKN